MLLFVLFIEVAVLFAAFFVWVFLWSAWTTMGSWYWDLTRQMREDGVENPRLVQGWVLYGLVVAVLNVPVWLVLL